MSIDDASTNYTNKDRTSGAAGQVASHSRSLRIQASQCPVHNYSNVVPQPTNAHLYKR